MFTKKLVLFLFINAIIAILLFITFLFKTKNSTIITQEVKQMDSYSIPEPIASAPSIPEPIASAPSITKPVASAPLVLISNSNNQANTNQQSCVIFSKLDLKQKETIDNILNQKQESHLVKIDKIDTYQIYWNLGKNQNEATKLFLRQKASTMTDPKFKLAQNSNGDWFVNIAEIKNSAILTSKLTLELAEKAKTVNPGGKWEFKFLSEYYTYTFNNYQNLTKSSISTLENTFSSHKKYC